MLTVSFWLKPWTTDQAFTEIIDDMSLRTTKDGLFQYSEENGGGGGGETSFRELSATEIELVMAHVAEVHLLLDRYLPGQSEQGISPRILDQLFIKWLDDTPR